MTYIETDYEGYCAISRQCGVLTDDFEDFGLMPNFHGTFLNMKMVRFNSLVNRFLTVLDINILKMVGYLMEQTD